MTTPSKATVRAAIRLLGEAVRLNCPATAIDTGIPVGGRAYLLARDARWEAIDANDLHLGMVGHAVVVRAAYRTSCAIAEQLLMQGWVP